ncbi:MAG TPA: class I SAM-dependent methyltransferase [Ilumatobacteraceae bacterium]
MSSHRDADLVFTGSIPELYERYLVPLIFQPYADDLAARVSARAPDAILEIAAGTGVVTRAVASALPQSSAITATDLNQPMIDHAAALGTARPVTWRQADAMDLPFPDRSFDVVICQFGAMFFPDRVAAYSEMRRVLRPGGAAIFNVWDRIERNEFALAVTDGVGTLFPEDPPRFLVRTPYAYHDTDRIRRDVLAAGFSESSTVDSVAARSRAASCTFPAIGFCQGSPLRGEIESRGPGRLEEATSVAADVVRDRFGDTDVDGEIRAHVVTALES